MQPTISLIHKSFALLALLWLAVAVACAPGPEPTVEEGGSQKATEKPSLTLDGTQWTLTGYGSADSLTTPAAAITIEFLDGQARGIAACNHYGGAYVLDDDKLTFSDGLSQTMMACEPAIMELEQQYLAALRAISAVQRDGDKLTLQTADGVWVFQPIVPLPDAPLEGTVWQLDSFVSNDAVTAYDVTITAEFAAGRISGSAGCNSYFTDYTLTGDKIQIGPVGSTKMACDEVKMEAEGRFLTGLGSAESYTIDGHTLTLQHAQGSLVFKVAGDAPTP